MTNRAPDIMIIENQILTFAVCHKSGMAEQYFRLETEDEII